MSQEPQPFIVDGYEITPRGIVLALLDGDLTDTEAAEWIEKLYEHRRAINAERRNQYAITGKCPGCGPGLGSCVCANQADESEKP